MRTIGRASIILILGIVAVIVAVYALPPASSGTQGRRLQSSAVDEAKPSLRSRTVSIEERADALARAQVWRQPPTIVSSAPMGTADQVIEELDCTFKLAKPSGTTPKFDCVDRSGTELRIKYGIGGELHAETAATHLLTALGFGADSVSFVKSLRCFGCPKEPFTVMKLVDATNTSGIYDRVVDEKSHEVFPWVALERRFPATAIETAEGPEGWAFYELDRVDPAKGGAPRAHVDALRLLAVFLAHWDNKSENQRLVCLSADWPQGTRCPTPFLILQDVGATFGPRKVDIADWEQAVIWENRATCTITMRSLPVSGATFQTVRVSDEGRLFLSGLLEQLTDDQLAALFSGARFDHRRGPLDATASVPEWVRVFKARRSEIGQGQACPPV